MIPTSQPKSHRTQANHSNSNTPSNSRNPEHCFVQGVEERKATSSMPARSAIAEAISGPTCAQDALKSPQHLRTQLVPSNCTGTHERQLNGLPVDHSVPKVCIRSASTFQLLSSHPGDTFTVCHT